MRVATEHVWRPGDSVQLSSLESGFRTQARVVYCQRVENNKFTVGLELLARTGLTPGTAGGPDSRITPRASGGSLFSTVSFAALN